MLKERRFNMNRKAGDKMTDNEAKLINDIVAKVSFITEKDIEESSMEMLDDILLIGTKIHDERQVN
tara:strand:+ start:154 stop:351 length:198 start_codon:yes stop_codon:yes gene_type:complete